MEVRQLKLEEKPTLLRFLRRSYGAASRHGNEAFWDWHFLEAPYADRNDLPVWVALDGAEVVGLLAAVEVRLMVEGEERRAIWILDLLIDPSYRRRGLAKKLALLSAEFCPIVLGINTAAQHSTELLLALGWQHVGNLPRYRAILNPGSALPSSVPRPLRQFANAALRRDKAAASRSVDIRPVSGFDATFDALCHEASRQRPCSVARRSELLAWQYEKQPWKRFDILGAYVDGRLAGYAVLFFRKADEHGLIRKAAITDLCYLPENSEPVLSALLSESRLLASERGAGTLVTDLMDAAAGESLVKAGFRSAAGPLQLLVRAGAGAELLYEAGNWFVTRGDSDTSIFEEPNAI